MIIILISQMILFSVFVALYNNNSFEIPILADKQGQFNLSSSDWANATVISDDSTGWNNGASLDPAIAIDNNGVIHIVWTDTTMAEWSAGGTDWEILYANYTAAGWSNATCISDDYTGWNNDYSQDPDIAIDQDGNIHVVWREDTDGTWGTDQEIMYVNYTAAGWSNATCISEYYESKLNIGDSANPSIAIDNIGNLHVVWNDDTDGQWGTDIDIMYTNYTATGWSNATVISDDFTDWNTGLSASPDIAIDNNGVIHVGWTDVTPGPWGSDYEIMYTNYTATGWSNATVISDLYGWNDGQSEGCQIAIDNNNYLHVVWNDETDGEWGTDQEIMYVNYTAAGWSNATCISEYYDSNLNTGDSNNPKLTIDNNENLHVVWSDDTVGEWGADREIMYVNYTATGWSNMSVISDDNTLWNDGSSLVPNIAMENTGNIHVVWSDTTNGEWGTDQEIMYSFIGDIEYPNIASVSRYPSAPGNLDTVNITVHITDNVGVDTVLINSNHTGTPLYYTMDYLSGTIQDGYWNYTIPTTSAGTKVEYSFMANDTNKHTVTDGPYQYIVLDNEVPNIYIVNWVPSNPSNYNTVNVTANVGDNIGVDTVIINSNHTGTPTNYTMDFLSGSAQLGWWNYTIPAYPPMTTITFTVYANDSENNPNTYGPNQYTIQDVDSPSIISVSQNPNQPSSQETVNITVQVTDNVGVHKVLLLIFNSTGGFDIYPMDFLSGTIQNGYWNYTIPAYPAGTFVNYTIYVNDTSNNPSVWIFENYTVRGEGEEPTLWPLLLMGGEESNIIVITLVIVVIGLIVAIGIYGYRKSPEKSPKP